MPNELAEHMKKQELILFHVLRKKKTIKEVIVIVKDKKQQKPRIWAFVS